jgi:hypothetical protein
MDEAASLLTLLMSRTRLRGSAGCKGDRSAALGLWGRRAIAARALAIHFLILCVLPATVVARECQTAFEAWVKLSERTLQKPRGGEGDRGACVATEDVRKELLNGLVRARALCEAESSLLDASPQQTKSMIDINENFIAALPVCRTEPAQKEWDTKASPQPTERRAASPPCLRISPSRPGEFALVNRRCAGESVLAVIEILDDSGKAECKVYTIGRRLTLRAKNNVPPRVNHECILNQERCNKDRVGSMFPECDWAGP